VVVNTPRDQEYLALTRNLEAQGELQVLGEQILDMEKEMKQLQNGRYDCKTSNMQSYPSPTSDDDTRDEHHNSVKVHLQETMQSTQLIRTDNDDPPRKVQYLMDEAVHGIGAQLYQIEDNADSKENQWALTITKKGLRIETNIKSMNDLIAQVKVMNFQLGNVEKPSLYSPLVGDQRISPSLMVKFGEKAWIKILEGNKKALYRCVVFMKDQALPDVNRIQMAQPDVSTAMTVQLLQIYFSCQHLKQMAIHRKTFLDLYFQPNNVKAPVYALCAAIVTMRCKHVLQVVPYESQLIYGEYYFSKARQLYSEQFDEISLETYCTLVFMTMYKATLLRPHEGDNYLNLAKRMGEELLPHYSQPATPPPGSKPGDHVGLRSFTLSGEAEMFKRLMRTCKQLNFRLFLLKQPAHMGGKPSHHLGPGSHGRPSHRMKGHPTDRYSHHQGVHPRSLTLSYCPDETGTELRYVQQSRYLALHRETIHSVMASVFPHFHDPLSTSFLIATITSFEQNLKNYYYQTLPQEMRIALPLFDDTISDTTLVEAVSFDRIRDSVPLTLLIAFYTEYIVVMKSLLPRLPQYDDSHLSFGVMSQETDEQREKYKEIKRQKRNHKLRHLINEYNLSMTEEQLHDFYHQQFDLPHNFQIEAQDKCTRAANLAVRLLEQLTNSSFSCHFELPNLMCTWDMHLRNSRLGHSKIDQPDGIVDPKITRQARQHLVRCLAIMRRGFLYNTAERELWKHYQLMEQELLRELSLDPTFKVTSGPEPEFHIGRSVNSFAT
jgi:hypothetical protein